MVDKTETTLSADENAVPYSTIVPPSNITSSLLPTKSLPQSQSTPEYQDDTVTPPEKLSIQLEADLQNQISRYDDLVELAKIFKQDWDNTGSLMSLNRYNALIRDIQMINDSLKIMGGTTLPNLPLLTLNQAEEFSNILEEDLLESDKKTLGNCPSEEEKLATSPIEKTIDLPAETFPTSQPSKYEGE